MRPARHPLLLALALAAACGHDSPTPSGPVGPGGGGSPGPGPVTSTAQDGLGDTFNTSGPGWDIASLSLTRDTDAVTVALTFTNHLISPASGDPGAMIAFVDFDTDLDPATGSTPVVDEFRHGPGSTGMGSDFQLNLAALGPDSTAAVLDHAGLETGRVKPAYNGTRVTVRIPLGLLGNDDGFLNASAIAGSLASPSDIVPEQGHLELRPSP